MAESTLSRLREQVANDPATDRLKQELQAYLQARAHRAVAGLGSRLGESAARLADPGQAASGLAGSLAKGGKALSEGKSPAQAAMAVGTSHVKEMLKDKVKGVFGKAGKSGGGKSKSVTVVEDIDVGVPVREAYDQWTQFQEFSTFAKGVVSVDKTDETSSNWKVKVAKSTRSLQADVTEQIPDRRISWTTDGAKGTVKGVVTFHPVTDDLTRVLLVLEYFPSGFFEKTGNIWRAQGRRARLDLKLYRKFITMRGEATDGWRGEIRDGEVVLGHDEAVEEEERAAQDGEEEGADHPADEYGADEHPEGEYDEGGYDERPEPEDEYDEEYEAGETDGLSEDEAEDEAEYEADDEAEYEDAEYEDAEYEEVGDWLPEDEYDEEYEPEEGYEEEEEAEDAEEEDGNGRRSAVADR